MPNIQAEPRAIGTEMVTYFMDGVGISLENFNYPEPQTRVEWENTGRRRVLLTIDGVNITLAPGDKHIATNANGISEFSVRAEFGYQSFAVKSFRPKEGESVDERLALLEERVQTGTGGGGSAGSLVFSSLSALQSAYPNGASQPVWVTGEKSWYYWNGTVITPPDEEPPPTDTTAPVLTITPAATFATNQPVNMSTNETATIWYTTDGSDPISSGTRQQYSSALSLSATTTVKAYAVDTAGNASAVQTVTYTKETVAHVTSGLIRYKANPTVEALDNSSELFAGTGNWTFETTITLGTVSGTRNILLRAIDSATSGGITGNSPSIQATFDHKLVANFWGRNTSNNASTWVSVAAGTDTVIPTDVPTHIAYMREGTLIKLLINNVLIKSATIASTVDLHANALAMSFLQSGQGIVAKNYAYYNRALTTEELTQNYNAWK